MVFVKAARDALLRPLQVVSGIVERRQTLPILANVLVRKTIEGLEIKLIDFGLALKREVVREGQAHADSWVRSVFGASILDTMEYSAPEILGRLPRVTAVAGRWPRGRESKARHRRTGSRQGRAWAR